MVRTSNGYSEFCEITMELCSNNPFFLNQIVFSDKATFFLNGRLTRQTWWHWVPDNPHRKMEACIKYPQKTDQFEQLIKRVNDADQQIKERHFSHLGQGQRLQRGCHKSPQSSNYTLGQNTYDKITAEGVQNMLGEMKNPIT